MIKIIIKNFLLVIVSSIFTILILEFTLYISGKIYTLYKIKNETAGLNDGEAIKILCLGDSFTFGCGADKGYSYPEQLQRILNEKEPHKKFVVYNSGICSLTSSQLLLHLEANLSKAKPDIVVILIGWNDDVFLGDTNYCLFQADKTKALFWRLNYFMSNSRVYKLFKLGVDAMLINQWKKKMSKKIFVSQNLKLSEPQDGQVMAMEESRKEAFKKHIELGDIYYNAYNRKFDLAINEYKKAIAAWPGSEWGHMGLAQVYFDTNNLELAAQELKQTVNINPVNAEAFRQLFTVYYNDGKMDLAQEAFEMYLYLNPSAIPNYRYSLIYGLPLKKDAEAFNNLWRHNLQSIIDFCRKKKTTLILLDYPQRDSHLALMQELATKNNIIFVRNELVFEGLKLKDGYQDDDYFVEDGHCKNRGYSIMAENIYNVIKDLEIINSPK